MPSHLFLKSFLTIDYLLPLGVFRYFLRKSRFPGSALEKFLSIALKKYDH
jgi:hypothetical protein